MGGKPPGDERWMIGPVPAAAVLAMALCLGLYALQNVRLGPAAAERFASATITVEQAGMDSRRIERAVTMPLEDALAGVPGISQVRSVSEDGRSRITVIAAAGEAWGPLSLALRDAVQRAAAALPATARKPSIVSRSLARRPVFVAAMRGAGMSVEELCGLAEQEVKPSFARVQGAGEVEIGGGAVREAHVRVDRDRAAARGISIAEVAGQLARQSVLAPAGTLQGPGSRLPAAVTGRSGSLAELASLPLELPGGGIARLGEVAWVGYGLRERESIGRIDGREAVVLSVEPSGTANLVALSRALRACAAGWEARGIGFDVVLDQGAALEASARGVLSALLQGLAVVTALLPVFVRRARRIVVLAASLPLTGILAVAALSAARVSLDSDLLSGLAVGIGTVVDTGIIVSEQRSVRAMRSLAPSLGASLATTLIVLAPLLFLEFAAAGIRQVALSIGLLLVISFALDMLFLPAFFLARPGAQTAVVSRPAGRARRLLARARRRCLRGLHALVDFTIRRRALVLAGAALLAAGAGASVFVAGRDFTAPARDDALFAHIEFEPGASLESVDSRVLDFTRRIAGRQGVLRVQSVARRGSAEMQVRYDPGLGGSPAVTALLEQEGARIPGGFLYLPDAAAARGRGIEVAIRGEDDGVLRSLARRAAVLLEASPGIRQVVLNFKEPGPALVVRMDAAKAARFGVRTAEAAVALRWALHGPVALTWIENDRETDLRVMEAGARTAGRADLLALPVRNSAGAVRPLGSFASLEARAEGGRISRVDRQRTVTLTVHAAAVRLDAAAARIHEALSALALPAGYAVELDREVKELDDSFRLLWAALGLSAVFVFLVLAGFGESLLAPLAVLSILPVSLAFPLAAYTLRGEPLRVPVLVGFILLAGMVVNNSILVIDAIRERLGRGGRQAGLRGALHLGIRSRIRPLLITSAATIAGTIPLAFSRVQGAGYLSSLAFVVAWGMLGSLASTILVVPALGFAAPRLVPPRPSLPPSALPQPPSCLKTFSKPASERSITGVSTQ